MQGDCCDSGLGQIAFAESMANKTPTKTINKTVVFLTLRRYNKKLKQGKLSNAQKISNENKNSVNLLNMTKSKLEHKTR